MDSPGPVSPQWQQCGRCFASRFSKQGMVHGWMTRGADDPMLPQPAGEESVRESQASALKLAADFLQQVQAAS